MGNATQRASQQNIPGNWLVNYSIAGIILANLLFLGQKMPVSSWIAKPRIHAQLRATENVLEVWRKHHGAYPVTLGEMMASAEIRAKNPAFYDAAGNRLQYIRLSLDAFILRSFGSDSIPASSTGDQDDVILESSMARNAGGMVLVAPDASPASNAREFTTWPPAATDGLWSPDGSWVARIASNPQTGERRVLVMKDDHSRLLVSPHDRIEEFFWERGHEPALIFSATGSDLYDDGVFRWRLSAAQFGDGPKMTNLLESARAKALPGRLGVDQKVSEGAQKSRWVIALLQPGEGIDWRSGFNVLAVREAELLASGGAKKFFDSGYLWRCPWGTGNCEHEKIMPAKSISFRLALDQIHRIRGRMTSAQQQWSRLPVRGRSQELLEAWFAAAASDSLKTLKPYVIFYAIVLQDQVQEQLQGAGGGTGNPSKRRQLSVLTSKMLETLLRDQETPRYLQALLVGGDRSSLKNDGNNSQPVFELTDATEPNKNAENRKSKADSKTGTGK